MHVALRTLSITMLALVSACGGGGGDKSASAGPPGGGSPASYSVGGTVSGLTGSGLVLRDNGGNDLAVPANGSFAFTASIASGAGYNVTVSTQPASPSQTCTVQNASGTVGSGNVTNVAVSCTTNTYKLGGTITGLQGSGLILEDNGSDDLPLSTSATTFTFATSVASGANYNVTVKTEPAAPAQRCSVSGATGTVGSADVTNVTVSCSAAPSGSSFDLIDADLQAGTITLETALEYKMFALFKDTRLPLAYQGDDSDVFESDVFDQVWANWGSLSDAAIQVLTPFLVPPIYTGSWAAMQSAGAPVSVRTQARIKDANSGWLCQQPTIDPNWSSVSGTNVKVWYDTRLPGAAGQAATALDELENTIWPAIVTRVGMKAPLSDGAVNGCNGGDGLLDVYLVDMATSGQVSTDLGETRPVRPALSASPTFILMSRNLDPNALKGSLAHEFTHASQWAYPVKALALDSYHWLKESTAQAAIDVVYPVLPQSNCPAQNVPQFEQCKAAAFMQTLTWSLDDSTDPARVYGSYLFFQFLTRTNSPSLLATIWSATASQSDQLLAVDGAITGGFKQQWPLFAKLLWNQPPVDVNSFSAWDSLKLTPTPVSSGGTSGAVSLSLDGGQAASIVLDGNIKHLATHYYWFKVTDPNVRSLIFENDVDAITPDPNIHVSAQAFYQTQGSTWQYAHWSQNGALDQTKFFCLDVVAERLQDLVIVLSNDTVGTDLTGEPDIVQPRVSISNAGCWRYSGTVTAHRDFTDSAGARHRADMSASVTYERVLEPAPLLYGGSGAVLFQLTAGGSLTASSEDSDSTGSLTQTATGPIQAESGAVATSLSVTAGFDMIGLGYQQQTVTAKNQNSTLTTHVVSVIGSVTQAYDNDVPWTWLLFTPDSAPKVLLQTDSSIRGNYTDPDSHTQYTWTLLPQRQ